MCKVIGRDEVSTDNYNAINFADKLKVGVRYDLGRKPKIVFEYSCSVSFMGIFLGRKCLYDCGNQDCNCQKSLNFSLVDMCTIWKHDNSVILEDEKVAFRVLESKEIFYFFINKNKCLEIGLL